MADTQNENIVCLFGQLLWRRLRENLKNLVGDPYWCITAVQAKTLEQGVRIGDHQRRCYQLSENVWFHSGPVMIYRKFFYTGPPHKSLKYKQVNLG